MSRISKTIKNAKVGLFFHSIIIVIYFFSRKYFLQYLGDEFIGITSTLKNIIGFLNLAELGIGTAVGFALYKPLFKEQTKEINKIVSLVGFLYKKIGIIILIIGIIVSFFFPFIFSKTEIPLTIIYFGFYSFLTSSLLSYYYNYHLILLEADQKAYIVTAYFQTANIFRLIIQTYLAIYTQNFALWIGLELFFSIVYSIILRKKIIKTYPWLIINLKTNKELLKDFKSLTKKIKQTFIHKISAFVLTSTDQLIIFTLISAKSVAFFGNYQLVFNQINNILSSFFKGSGASIGNLVAEGNKPKISKVFWELMALRYFIGGFIAINIFYLLEPFIKVWLGSKYLLSDDVLILMTINFLISQVRVPVENFKNAYGLFSDTWAPIVEILVNLIISIIFGSLWGITGIMLGTLTSLTLIVVLWKPYFLYKQGFKLSFLSYWKNNIKLITSLSISFFFINLLITSIINVDIEPSFFNWILFSIKTSLIILLIYSPILYMFNKGFRDIINRVIKILKK